MARKRIYQHSSGEFLNKPGFHSDATIFSEIKIECVDDQYINNDYTLRLRDCNETISIAIGIEDTEELDNVMFKLDTMINHLKKLKKACKEAHLIYVKKSLELKNRETKS